MSTPAPADLDDFDDLLTDDTPAPGSPWEVGEIVTIMVAGTTAAFGVPMLDLSKTYRRGDQVTVTQATLDHRGELLDLIDDADAQIRKWGEQRFVRGAVDFERWHTAGDAEWHIAHTEARRVANAIIDHDERNAALRAVRERFGVAPSSTATHAYRDLAQERRMSDDAAARKAHGVQVYRSS